MIEFHGIITRELMERARQRHAARVWLGGGLLLVIAGIVGFLTQPAPLEPSRHFLPIFAALLGGAIVTVSLARPPAELPKVEVRGSASEQRLTIRIAEDEEHVQWSDFSGAIHGPDYVVLQRSRFFIFVFGREFFRDEGSWNEFRAIIERSVQTIQPQTMPRTVMMILVWLGLFGVAMLVASWLR